MSTPRKRATYECMNLSLTPTSHFPLKHTHIFSSPPLYKALDWSKSTFFSANELASEMCIKFTSAWTTGWWDSLQNSCSKRFCPPTNLSYPLYFTSSLSFTSLNHFSFFPLYLSLFSACFSDSLSHPTPFHLLFHNSGQSVIDPSMWFSFNAPILLFLISQCFFSSRQFPFNSKPVAFHNLFRRDDRETSGQAEKERERVRDLKV